MATTIKDRRGRTWVMFSKSDPMPLPPGAFNGRWDDTGRLISWCTLDSYPLGFPETVKKAGAPTDE